MSSLPRPSFFAYLDLVCCAMGAGMLLFLIAVSAAPADTAKSPDSQLLTVRCVHVGGPRLEVGIEMRREGATEWVRAAGPDQVAFVAPSDPKSGAEACLVLLAPPVGDWEFRPYLVDLPQGDEPVLVKLEAYGHPTVPSDQPDELRPLRKTGEGGTVLKVRVQPIRRTAGE